MNSRHNFARCLIAIMVTPGTIFSANTVAAQTVPDDAESGIQVLTRGPVHEAFAETISFDARPRIVVPKTPPAAIEELPPEQKPEGSNVAWIPGYWAWDDDGSDFLWVSGIWRALPPGRQWIPGYWTGSQQGAQWTSGYWADARLTETEYLPEPPGSVEAGPNIPAPSPDDLWLPGNWVWQQNRYAWRPGFWSAGQPNWSWTPAHYTYTPRGYIYVRGYWDYPVARRGVLFAPVSFQQRVYSRRGFSYTPSTVINLGVFSNHLFLRPNYGHYYYGDYYGANYSTAGFYPWFSFNSRRQGYDPIYSQQRWNHRQDTNWNQRVQADFQHRRDHDDARPPRTLAAQQQLVSKGTAGHDQGHVIAQPLEQLRNAQDSHFRYQPLNQEDRQRYSRLGQEVRTIRDERQKLEGRSIGPTGVPRAPGFEPGRLKLSQSPYVGQSPDDLRQKNALPPQHQAPRIDPNVVAKPRQPRSGSAKVGEMPNVGQPQGRSGGKSPEAGASKVKPPGGSPGKSQGKSQQKQKGKPGGK